MEWKTDYWSENHFMSALETEQVKIGGSQCSETGWILEGSKEAFRFAHCSAMRIQVVWILFKQKVMLLTSVVCQCFISLQWEITDINTDNIGSNFPPIATVFTNWYYVINESQCSLLLSLLLLTLLFLFYYLQRHSQDFKFPISSITFTDHSCWLFNASSMTNKYITQDNMVKYGFWFYMYV